MAKFLAGVDRWRKRLRFEEGPDSFTAGRCIDCSDMSVAYIRNLAYSSDFALMPEPYGLTPPLRFSPSRPAPATYRPPVIRPNDGHLASRPSFFLFGRCVYSTNSIANLFLGPVLGMPLTSSIHYCACEVISLDGQRY